MQKIRLKNFGDLLNPRPDDKEALATIRPNLKSLGDTEKIIIDFSGIKTFTPSWGDEFIMQLIAEYGHNRIILQNTENTSVQATLDVIAVEY